MITDLDLIKKGMKFEEIYYTLKTDFITCITSTIKQYERRIEDEAPKHMIKRKWVKDEMDTRIQLFNAALGLFPKLYSAKLQARLFDNFDEIATRYVEDAVEEIRKITGDNLPPNSIKIKDEIFILSDKYILDFLMDVFLVERSTQQTGTPDFRINNQYLLTTNIKNNEIYFKVYKLNNGYDAQEMRSYRNIEGLMKYLEINYKFSITRKLFMYLNLIAIAAIKRSDIDNNYEPFIFEVDDDIKIKIENIADIKKAMEYDFLFTHEKISQLTQKIISYWKGE